MARNSKKGQARKPAPVVSLQDYPRARKSDVDHYTWTAACTLAGGDRSRIVLGRDSQVIVLNPRT